MYKFMILFNQPQDVSVFEDAYNAFLDGLEEMPGILRRQVSSIMGSPQGETTLYRILEVYFEDEATLMESLRSPVGQNTGTLLRAFAPGAFQMVFAEVYEEAGGQTQVVGGGS